MVSAQITICNKRGLHARAATKFAKLSSEFSCKLHVHCNGKSIDGKSIMALMLLAACQGTKIEIRADGPDEEQALDALVDLVDSKFHEGE